MSRSFGREVSTYWIIKNIMHIQHISLTFETGSYRKFTAVERSAAPAKTESIKLGLLKNAALWINTEIKSSAAPSPAIAR